MDSSYTNPYGAQPSIPSGGQDPNAWPPVSDPSASPAQPQYAAPAEPVAIEPAQPQYATPVEPAQPQYTAPEPYQPAAYQQPQYSAYSAPVNQYGDSYIDTRGDIILAPSQSPKKLDPKRILILAGVGLVVVVLLIVVVANIFSRGGAIANTEAKDFLERNQECIATLEDDDIWAASGSSRTVSYLSSSKFSETKQCVEQLSSEKEQIANLGSWSGSNFTSSEFETLKQNLGSFISMEEKKLTVYEDFSYAYNMGSINFVQKYLTVADDSNESEEALDLRLAAERLKAYFEAKDSIVSEAENNYCNVNLTYDKDDACAVYSDNFKNTENEFANNTSIIKLMVLAFGSDYDVLNGLGISQRINLMLGTSENE